MIKKIDKVYCSLNLGYVYNLNYSFVPQQGIRMTLFFINETGKYKTNILSSQSKTQIKIGNAVFNMYPVRARESKSGTEKTLSVDFIDDTFRLNNYYIALTDKGCGKNVFQLGKTVDKRTDAEKEKEDPDLFKIKEFTTFDDVEYSFKEFVDTLRKVFPVKTTASIDQTITRPFTGTFAEVLNAWCSYFNLSYFFENGQIVIFDPTSLNITFPSIPDDAISSSYEESIENMYDKTVWNAFTDNGGERELKASSSDNVFLTNQTLYPWENVFDVKNLNVSQNGNIDKLQLAAAQYGKEFWFLYNYFRGTAEAECGFAPVVISQERINRTEKEIKDALGSGARIAFFDRKKFDENFQKYFNYGRQIAGRYYVSNAQLGIDNFKLYTWYDVNSINPLTITVLRSLPEVKPEIHVNPVGKTFGVASETDSIGGNYIGLLINGTRMYWKDKGTRDFDSFFAKTEQLKKVIDGTFEKIAGGKLGSAQMTLADGQNKSYILFEAISEPAEIATVRNSLQSKTSIFNYRYNQNFQIRGYFNSKQQTEDPNLPFDNTDIQITNAGPTVVSNTSVIKVKKDSDFVAYYSKYASCIHESTDSGALNRRFESISPSIDVSTPIDVTKNSKGVVTINRNLSYLKLYQDSNILKKIAKAFVIPEKKLEFTLNYFYESIPTSFLSNGLVGISISVSERGLTASYTYSNEMLKIPESEQFIEKLERSIKNSYVRDYVPVPQNPI